jgi:hypothetical protein
VERFELPSTVLETAILPLNYTCFYKRLYPGRSLDTPFTVIFII